MAFGMGLFSGTESLGPDVIKLLLLLVKQLSIIVSMIFTVA